MIRKGIRKYPRVSSSFPVAYTVGNKTFRDRATTLGGGGLFIRTQQPLAAGTEVTLRFRPAKHLPVIEARGRVCYQLPGQGTAVEFTELRPVHRNLLLRLIHHKTADKRKYPRAPLVTQIECQEFTSLAFSRDVSVGGIFIETKLRLPAPSQLTLRFHLDDGGPIVQAVAEVKYSVPKLGLGVQFIEIAPADVKRIEAYISKSLILPPATAAAKSAK